MLFNSFLFFCFLGVIWILYWGLINKNLKYQNLFLLISSYVFYGWWDWRFLSLIIISSVADYILALKIYETDVQKQRKRLLYLSLLVNLGILFTFKYFGFFADSVISLMNLIGLNATPLTIKIIVPVGLSFYTFQTLSYTIDVYRNQYKPTRDFISFMAFVGFFPQLMAGPIERAKNLLPQFQKIRQISPAVLIAGFELLLWGLFKKVVVGDNLVSYLDQVYGHHMEAWNFAGILNVIFGGIQVYCDFSGYSNMARGIALLFGFRLMKNFNNPFHSTSMHEFWTRWHISLSNWFKNYVYIPLGGSQKGRKQWMLVIMVVFFLSGLWHGAQWTFVVWGILNGLVMVVESIVMRYVKVKGQIGSIVGRLYVFFVFSFLAVIFYSASIPDFFNIFGQIFQGENIIFSVLRPYLTIVCLLFSILVLSFEWLYTKNSVRSYIKKSTFLRWSGYYALLVSLILFGSMSGAEFVYFQF